MALGWAEFSGAAVRTWQGQSNGLWSVSGNWQENTAPVHGDQLVFPAASRYTVTNDLSGLRLDRITFAAAGYVVRGQGVTISNGIVHAPTNAPAANYCELNLTLGAAQTFRCEQTNLVLSGTIQLGTFTLTVSNAPGTEVVIGVGPGSGVLQGSGGLAKDGAGTLRLAGSANPNSYSGPTWVRNGTLVLDRAGVISIPGPGMVTVGDGVGAAQSAVLLLAASDAIGAVPLWLNVDGLLDLAGHTNTIAATLTLNGGDVALGTGRLILEGGLVGMNSASEIFGRNGEVYLPGIRTFDVTNGVSVAVQAPLSGPGGVVKTGAGWLELSAPGAYAGPTVLAQGVVAAWNTQALGSTNVGTVVSNGATLALSGGLTYAPEPLVLNGVGVPGYGTLDLASGTATWTGRVTLNAPSSIMAFGVTALLRLGGVVEGPGDFWKTGAGTVSLEGTEANTFAGVTRVWEGTLRLAKADGVTAVPRGLVVGDGWGGPDADVVEWAARYQLGATDVVVNESGLLTLSLHAERAQSLTGNGRVDLGSGGQLAFGAGGGNTVFSGVISGSGGLLLKEGTGTATLTGHSSFGGLTRVNAGRLLVHGSLASSAVEAAVHGVLGGRGVVGPLSVFGQVAPGESPGALTCGNVVFVASGSFAVELDGLTPGSGHDQLRVQGTVALNQVPLQLTVGFAPSPGDAFVVVDNDGTDAVIGTFAGLPEGAVVEANGLSFRISYAGGTGNDVVLTHVPVLRIAPAGPTNVVLWWPAQWTGARLEQRDDLAAGGWTEVGDPGTVVGDYRFVTNATGGAHRFFQLRLP